MSVWVRAEKHRVANMGVRRPHVAVGGMWFDVSRDNRSIQTVKKKYELRKKRENSKNGGQWNSILVKNIGRAMC